MFLGRVIGTVVSTIKHPAYDDTKLMVVQPTDPDGSSHDAAIVAVDAVGAGVGEQVLVLRQGIAVGRCSAWNVLPSGRSSPVSSITSRWQSEPLQLGTRSFVRFVFHVVASTG